MNIVQIIIAAVPELIKLIRLAFEGDMDAVRRVKEILPADSLAAIELVKKAADEAAKKKFGLDFME